MEGEPLDGSAGNSDGELGGQATGTKTESQIRAELETEFKSRLTEMLEGNEAYKGLQRAQSRIDREYKSTLSSKEAELATLREQLQGMQEGMNYLSGTLMSALPEEDRARVESELRQKQIENLTRKVQQLDRRPATPATVAVSDEMEEMIKRLQNETRESMEETARLNGLDPKDKNLDFGEDDDSFPARLKKFNKSVEKAKKAAEDAEVESVKQKVPTAATRTTGGTDAGDGFGESFLDRGAQEVWERMQRQSRTTKKVA